MNRIRGSLSAVVMERRYVTHDAELASWRHLEPSVGTILSGGPGRNGPVSGTVRTA
jgi:hypothetical protein